MALANRPNINNATGGSRRTLAFSRACSLPICLVIGAVTFLASSAHWPTSKATDCAMPAAKTVRPLCADNRGVRPSPRPFKGAAAPPVNSLF